MVVFWPWNTRHPPTNVLANTSTTPPNSVTINTGKPEAHNQTLHGNDSCTANAQTQTPTQEEKPNVDTIKRIMSEKNTALLSLRNQNWRTVKLETEKVNDWLTNIPTNDINDLTYAEAKFASEKNRGLLDDHRQKVKTRVGSQTWIAHKKTTATSKNAKTEH